MIGVEEPMLVCGAIASTSAAWPITAPAESALDPDGETYTSTGTFAASIPFTIDRIDDESPPGVSISITTAATCSRSPRWTTPRMKSRVTGLTSEWNSATRTLAAAARAAPVRNSAARKAAKVRRRPRARRAFTSTPTVPTQSPASAGGRSRDPRPTRKDSVKQGRDGLSAKAVTATLSNAAVKPLLPALAALVARASRRRRDRFTLRDRP